MKTEMQNNIRDNQKGQSTIEFLSTFIFTFGFIMLFYKIAVDSTTGYFVHYANFMASRAYLVVETNSNTADGADGAAFSAAKDVFENYYQVPKFFKNGFPGNFEANDPTTTSKKLYIGTKASFQTPFSFTKMIGGKTPVNYLSESFLGREPTRAECLTRICKAMEDIGANCSDQSHVTYYDNGC